MDCSALRTGAALSSNKSSFKGVGLVSVQHASVGMPLNSSSRTLRVCNALQEEEGRKQVPVLSASTVFKVAGAAATLAALVFTLPLPLSPKKGKERDKATEMDKMKSLEKGKYQKKIEDDNSMPVEERIKWTEGLPVVQEKIAYTSILDFHEQKKIKHIIKYPRPPLGIRPQVVLIVLDDNRVVRSVLPAFNRDLYFWKQWKASKLGSFVVEAFTPPIPKPESPWKDISLPFWTQKPSKPTKKEQPKRSTKKPGPLPKGQQSSKAMTPNLSARLEQLERARKDLERTREMQDTESRRRKLQQAQSNAKALQEKQLMQNREERAQAKKSRSENLVQQEQAGESWISFWDKASSSEGFRFMLGVFFFWLFYQTVVLGVKKKRKDYEDRLKLEKAEEEERKRMEAWEDQVDVAEAMSTMQSWDLEKKNKQEKGKSDNEEQNPQFQMGLRFMRSGARVRRAKSKRPPKYLDLDADVKFEDVAGLGEIRLELEEIVDFFRNKQKYLRRGSRIPSGILLCGEPGTGKTLLAKAVAGEAGVNFFSISASQFVEIYVGVGASRVRALYQEARENAPAVVFIDELDAVGRQRGLIGGSGGQERDATLNQLLTCLDGFEGKGDVITVAATNRVDILDSALVRPGRFDRKIFIPKPSVRGRIEILKVHSRNKPMADDVDYDAVGFVTDGMVGAQLANVVDIAALAVLREGRTEIATDDLLDAASFEEGGHSDFRPRSRELWYKMALNEAALAVAAINFPDFKDVQLVSIIPRTGEEKGSVRARLDSMKFETSTISRQGIMDYMTMQLAPRAADELIFGQDQMCTIWADHYNHARRVARYYVFCGLLKNSEVYGMFHCWSELDRYYEVDRSAKKLLESCYERAQKIMESNQILLKTVTDLLVEKKVVKGEQFWRLVDEYANYEEAPPLPVDVRRKKLEEFREIMISEKRVASP